MSPTVITWKPIIMQAYSLGNSPPPPDLFYLLLLLKTENFLVIL